MRWIPLQIYATETEIPQASGFLANATSLLQTHFCYSYALPLSLNVLKQAIIRDLNTDLQEYRVTSVLAVLKCSGAVLQFKYLTAS